MVPTLQGTPGLINEAHMITRDGSNGQSSTSATNYLVINSSHRSIGGFYKYRKKDNFDLIHAGSNQAVEFEIDWQMQSIAEILDETQ